MAGIVLRRHERNNRHRFESAFPVPCRPRLKPRTGPRPKTSPRWGVIMSQLPGPDLRRRRRPAVLAAVVAVLLGLATFVATTAASAADTLLSQGKPALASSQEG